MTKDRAVAKVIKLLVLAERGEEGERENAQKLADNIMSMFQLTVEDLELENQPKTKPVYLARMAQRLRAIGKSIAFRKNQLVFSHVERGTVYAAKLAQIEIELENLVQEIEIATRRLPLAAGQKRAPTVRTAKAGDLHAMQRRYM